MRVRLRGPGDQHAHSGIQPRRRDRSILVLNALLGLGTVLAPVFVAIFDGLGFWWGLPLLWALLLVVSSSSASGCRSRPRYRVRPCTSTAGIPRRFWVYAGFAGLYGVCETVNGNWSQLT